MATIGNTQGTLMDLASRSDDSGKLADIVEMLNIDNEIQDDMLWVEANEASGHLTTIRTGLPDVYWRMLNQGVPSSKSTTAQVREPCAELAARAQCDVKLAQLSGNPGKFRIDESSAFVEAMSQEFAQTLFYGAASSPKEFVGLANRYSSLSAANGENIIAGGGAGSDNTSIWLINWSPLTVHGIYSKGTTAGLKHMDKGEELVDDGSGSNAQYNAYRDWFEWQCGLAVRDWRGAVRICNIDVSNLVGETSAADILKLMTKASHKKMGARGRMAFYCNRDVKAMLDIQAQAKNNVYLTIGEEEGRPKVSFRGIPIRTCDSILNTEALVS